MAEQTMAKEEGRIKAYKQLVDVLKLLRKSQGILNDRIIRKVAKINWGQGMREIEYGEGVLFNADANTAKQYNVEQLNATKEEMERLKMVLNRTHPLPAVVNLIRTGKIKV